MAKRASASVEEVSTVSGPPELRISPGKVPVIGGNFIDMRTYLEGARDRYANVDISKLGMEEVLRVKKQFQTLRTTVEKLEKDVIKTYFNDPKKIIAGEFAVMYPIIAEIESKLDDAIAKDDQKRIDGINLAIDAYVAEFTSDMPLDEEYLSRVERKKVYYNKTQAEKDTRNDILAQITLLHKEQKAEKANIRVIKAACAKDSRLSEALFLDLLCRGDDVSSVLEAIEAELARLNEATKEPARIAESGTQDDEVVYEYVVPLEEEAASIDYTSDLPDRVKTVVVEITYPADVADSLTKLFSLLHRRGIRSKIIS